jgi:uncharacterized protein (TIGR03083 family)
MDHSELLACLDSDYRRLREVAGACDLDAAVPSAPGWTVADLLQHLGAVYLHKVECIRLGAPPEPWPPAGLNDEDPRQLFDRAYAELAPELAARKPSEPAFTWHGPNQTVSFWIRRMAQETVIHRVDGELGAGVPIAPISAELAEDGIDELLMIFVDYGFSLYPEELPGLLDGYPGGTVLIRAGERAWLLRIAADSITVEPSPGEVSADAEISGPPTPLLLWLWNRGGAEDVSVTGDPKTLRVLRDLLEASTQ